MTGTFVLGLDTTPPAITWGTINGTEAGNVIHIGWEVDEPEVISMTLTLPDLRVIPMDLGPPATVLLPLDTPEGVLLLTATTVDETLNAGTELYYIRYTFALSGVGSGARVILVGQPHGGTTKDVQEGTIQRGTAGEVDS